MKRLYAIGNYNDKNEAVWFKVLTARNNEHAWEKGSFWMDVFVGEEMAWLMEAKDYNQAMEFIDFCDRGEFDAYFN